jgi:aspartate aminotransferase-like enzyme
MGRSFESVRMGAKETSNRWLKASRALKKEDQIYGQRLAEMAKMHSSEAFYALDDPLEATVFSVLVELIKELDQGKKSAATAAISGDETSTGVDRKA